MQSYTMHMHLHLDICGSLSFSLAIRHVYCRWRLRWNPRKTFHRSDLIHQKLGGEIWTGSDLNMLCQRCMSFQSPKRFLTVRKSCLCWGFWFTSIISTTIIWDGWPSFKTLKLDEILSSSIRRIAEAVLRFLGGSVLMAVLAQARDAAGCPGKDWTQDGFQKTTHRNSQLLAVHESPD